MPRGDGAGERGLPLCVGVALTTDPTTTRGLLDDFCRALSDAAQLDVVGRSYWHYHRLLEGLEAGEVHLAWLPPILAMRAIAQRRVIPIALPIRRGVSVYSTALFARESSRFETPSDLQAVKAAWVDRQSAAGFLIIRAELRAQGVDLEKAFSADQFLGAHDAVARAVLDGEADVGATFVYFAPGGEILRAGWGGARVRVIASAGPIPSDVVAASLRMPAAVARSVQRALVESPTGDLAATARALLGAEGFTVPLAEHLDPLTRLLARIELTADEPHSLVPPPVR